MWDYDSFMAKALLYNQRAANQDTSSLDFGLWLALGFEFLTRSVLAKVHPTLLAEPNGDSVLAAAGVVGAAPGKSIPSHTVMSRLRVVVPDFTPEIRGDADFIVNMRNAELHTGFSAFENEPIERWLPKLVRASRVLATHLSVDVETLLGGEVVSLGEKLSDEENKRLTQEVAKKINAAREFAGKLTASERSARTPSSVFVVGGGMTQECPACSTKVRVSSEEVRTSEPRLEDGVRVANVRWLVTGFDCPVCGLSLTSTAEVAGAKLLQGYETTVELEDTYEDHYEPDYGND